MEKWVGHSPRRSLDKQAGRSIVYSWKRCCAKALVGAAGSLGAATASENAERLHATCPVGELAMLALEYRLHAWRPAMRYRQFETECEGSVNWRTYFRTLAQLEALVGNHDVAMRKFDRTIRSAQEAGRASPLSANVRATGAVDHIVQAAAGREIVVINERHHVSRDRLLTLELLEPMALLGYRVLAVEAVSSADLAISSRGYPTVGTGYYTNDVVFAETLREALRLGYEILAYERRHDQEDAPDGRTMPPTWVRNYWQAANIVDAVRRSRDTPKVIVHCGHGHVFETPGRMAAFLEEIGGVNPLTVDQARLGERSSAEVEHRWRVEARARGLLGAEPVVLVDGETGQRAGLVGTDISVLAPVTRETRGESDRPEWMTMGGRRLPVNVRIPECPNTSCVVEARSIERPDESAFDRVEVGPDDDEVVLYLPGGLRMEVLMYDWDGMAVWRGQTRQESD